MSEAPTGKNALLPKAKLRVRVSTAPLDDEVMELIEAALADMKRQGIDTARLCPETATASEMEPLAVRAVMLYCKAHFGVGGDLEERRQYMDCYKSLTQSMAMTPEYIAGGEGDAGDESAG